MNVGRSIKIALIKKGMQQGDLAEKMGVTKPYISQLAGKERAGMGTVALLAIALDMKISDFIALGED